MASLFTDFNIAGYVVTYSDSDAYGRISFVHLVGYASKVFPHRGIAGL